MLDHLPKTVRVFLPTREFFAQYPDELAKLQRFSNVRPDDFARLTAWFVMSDPNRDEFPSFEYFHEMMGEVLARDSDVDTFHFGEDEAVYEKFIHLLYELYKYVRPYQELLMTTRVPGARVSHVWFDGWSGNDMLVTVEFSYTLCQMDREFVNRVPAAMRRKGIPTHEP